MRDPRQRFLRVSYVIKELNDIHISSNLLEYLRLISLPSLTNSPKIEAHLCHITAEARSIKVPAIYLNFRGAWGVQAPITSQTAQAPTQAKAQHFILWTLRRDSMRFGELII